MKVGLQLVVWLFAALVGLAIVGSIVLIYRGRDRPPPDRWAELSKPVERGPQTSDAGFDVPRKTAPEFIPHTMLPEIPDQPTDRQVAGSPGVSHSHCGMPSLHPWLQVVPSDVKPVGQ